jgi:hypothetical protein
MSEEQTFVCPDCGEGRFSWIVEMVQFGTVTQYDTERKHAEGYEIGEVKGTDIGENGVFCTSCDEFRDVDELEPEE